MTKTLVIGLDGATLDLIEPWAKAGKLPTFARLMSSGAYGRLQSVLPVLSSAAWSSFTTGMNPGKHGLYDFVKRATDSYRLRPVSREQMGGQSLWKILSEMGQKVIVLNVPMTYPPEAVNGMLVSGLGTPDYKTFTYPSDLTDTLLRRNYRVNSEVAYQAGREGEYLAEVEKITAQLTDTALWLMNTHEWDFFMVVYREADEMAHFFLHFMDPTHPMHPTRQDTSLKDAILKYYQRMDGVIGQLLEASGADTDLFIMSDHGTGPFYKDVLLNEWLRQKGWLAVQSGGGKLSRQSLARLGVTRANISFILRRLGLGRVERWIKDVLGNRIEILPTATHAQFPDAIDWQHTKAYSFGYHGQIYVNLRGREPQGIVAPGAEYEQLCREMSDALMTMTDPEDGKPVVDRVIHRSQAFHGPAYESAPDLIVIMRQLSYITRSGYELGKAGEIFTPPHQFQAGSHRMEGVLMMSGPGTRQAGYLGNQACLTDLAPTILHLRGFPVPDSMDGKVLLDWLTAQRAVRSSSTEGKSLPTSSIERGLSPEQEEALTQRLKELGYLA